jgi:hypothetical protein
MPGSYARLFSTYTDEQLLELASQRASLLGAGREALDEEMRKRGYDPDEPHALRSGNFARLLASYSQEQLLVLASQRDSIHREGQLALDEELVRRGLAPKDPQAHLAGLTEDQATFRVDALSKFFLRAPHYEIFLLLSVLYVAFFIAATRATFRPLLSLKDIGWPTFMSLFLIELLMLCYMGWQWSLGAFLVRITHPALSMKRNLFEFAIAYPPIYFLFFFVAVMFPNPRFGIFLVPFHLLAMACLFYDLYFVSKSLALAETARPVSFYDYAGPFFLLWCFPFGIWIIQPRINRLYESTMEHFATSAAPKPPLTANSSHRSLAGHPD